MIRLIKGLIKLEDLLYLTLFISKHFHLEGPAPLLKSTETSALISKVSQRQKTFLGEFSLQP